MLWKRVWGHLKTYKGILFMRSVWPQCLMKQKCISVTQNPQKDILDTHGGRLIACFEKYGILRLISMIYCLEIEFEIVVWKHFSGTMNSRGMLDPSAAITGMGWYRRPPRVCLLLILTSLNIPWLVQYHFYCLEATVYTRVLEYISENIFCDPSDQKDFNFIAIIRI